jgi:hypothetical protein
MLEDTSILMIAAWTVIAVLMAGLFAVQLNLNEVFKKYSQVSKQLDHIVEFHDSLQESFRFHDRFMWLILNAHPDIREEYRKIMFEEFMEEKGHLPFIQEKVSD